MNTFVNSHKIIALLYTEMLVKTTRKTPNSDINAAKDFISYTSHTQKKLYIVHHSTVDSILRPDLVHNRNRFSTQLGYFKSVDVYRSI